MSNQYLQIEKLTRKGNNFPNHLKQFMNYVPNQEKTELFTIAVWEDFEELVDLVSKTAMVEMNYHNTYKVYLDLKEIQTIEKFLKQNKHQIKTFEEYKSYEYKEMIFEGFKENSFFLKIKKDFWDLEKKDIEEYKNKVERTLEIFTQIRRVLKSHKEYQGAIFSIF